MFANCQMGGQNFGFPDVCLTPSPAGPVPIPYPNISTGVTANPGTVCESIFIDCMPVHNLMTEVPLSMGDNAGVNGGVVSGMEMGPTRHLLGSVSVFYEAMPATRLTDMTGQNGVSMNCPGMTIVPAQVTVLILT